MPTSALTARVGGRCDEGRLRRTRREEGVLQRGRRLPALIAVLFVGVVACAAPADARDPAMYVDPPTLLAGAGGVYVDPDGPAARWVAANPSAPAADAIRRRIADRPAARHVTAPVSGVRAEVSTYVSAASRQNRQPVFVADAFAALGCVPSGYDEWFAELAAGVGERRALVVVRDAECTTDPLRTTAMTAAVRHLRDAAPRALIFLDATRVAQNPGTLSTWPLADVTGVTINLGGYTPEERTDDLAATLHTATRDDLYVLADSSRAGAPATTGCNPPDARLGSYEILDADPGTTQHLWLTTPGVSDGPCGAAPTSTAGEFVPELATTLITPR